MAHRGSRGIALPFLDHGNRRGWGVSVTPWPLFTSGKDPVPIVQEAGWTPGPVWTGAENLVPTGIRSPDRPVRSQSLYQLCYLAHIWHCSNRQTGGHAFVVNIKPSWLYILSDIYILHGTISVTTPCTCAEKGGCVLLPTGLSYQGSLKPTSKLMKFICI
jgi:hypothetical protein